MGMCSRRALLNEIFEVLTEGPTLRSLVSLAAMKGAVVFRSGIGMAVWLRFRTLHPGFTLDGFEDILNRELQQSEIVIHPVGSKWALLKAPKWSLLESASSATLIVDRGVSVLRLRFCPVVDADER